MNITRTLLAGAFALIAVSPSMAQESHAGHGTAAATSYPDVCKSSMQMSAPMHSEADLAAMKDHQKAAIQGMEQMDRDMMQGMMKDDADVAFVCGMIAHHQGAIDMANVELQHGDNAWAKEMAQKVINAQTKEIAEMTDWLKDNAK